MTTILEVLSIMIVSAGFFWGGIPLGLTMDYSPLSAGLITVAGAELAVLLVLLLGTPLQTWLSRRFPAWIEKTRTGRAGQIWQSYGMFGLGFISPILPGAPQSALLALALGAHPLRIFLAVSVGLLFWGSLAVAGIAFGFNVMGVTP